jgi:DNA polymerase I
MTLPLAQENITDTAIPFAAQDGLILVDASGFIFRAFHALPPLTRASDQTPIGAVMGFCNIMVKLCQDFPNAKIAVIFDSARETFRNQIYDQYKANRSETPPDLVPQFPIVREATESFGLPVIELSGFEADDLIASYAAQASSQSIPVTIVSSDKDLMQLVSPLVRMMDPIKNLFIYRDQVFEKFGVAPEQVIDVQSLAGDAIDNVPGVPGIGIKTAAQLIVEYGSLEQLLEKASEIKQPKRREALIAHADDARISKQLVTLKTDLDLPVSLSNLTQASLTDQSLFDFLNQQGFKSLLARLNRTETFSQTPILKSVDTKTDEIPTVKLSAQKGQYQLVQTSEDLQKIVLQIKAQGLMSVDTETTSLTPSQARLVGISIAVEEAQAFYIPLTHFQQDDLLGSAQNKDVIQLDVGYVMTVLKPLLEDPAILKIGHNLKYDWQLFHQYGIQITPCEDTMLMSYVLNGTKHGHGLDELAHIYCGHKMISYDEITGTGKNRISFDQVALDRACDYAAEDADFTLRLYHVFRARLAREKMMFVYEDIERPLIDIIAKMEFQGVLVDPIVLKHLSHIFSQKISDLEANIFAAAGHSFNIGSPKQLGVVLFEELGLSSAAKTKTGDYSTAADVLEDLAAQGHQIVEKILQWRHLSKLKSTYTEALQESISPRDKRVHTSYSLAATTTGRLSSSDPNLQNIPIRTEEGKLIRTAFVAKDNHVLLSADYSQIELRLIAEMAGIDALKQAFLKGEDIHALTASQVFDVPLEHMTADIRRKAKAINFGIIYGISGYGLAKQLDCTPSEANFYIKQYFTRFPELAQYMERSKQQAREHGFVKTLLGRKCTIDGIHDKNQARRAFAERQAINAPIQGTAADLIKLAMIKVEQVIAQKKLPATLLLQVHDELIFEVDQSAVESVAADIKSAMQSVLTLSIPLTAEAGWALNWADAH